MNKFETKGWGEVDKEKLTKWITQEIRGCDIRNETERATAMRELLLKIERGYFDEEAHVQ